MNEEEKAAQHEKKVASHVSLCFFSLITFLIGGGRRQRRKAKPPISHSILLLPSFCWENLNYHLFDNWVIHKRMKEPSFVRERIMFGERRWQRDWANFRIIEQLNSPLNAAAPTSFSSRVAGWLANLVRSWSWRGLEVIIYFLLSLGNCSESSSSGQTYLLGSKRQSSSRQLGLFPPIFFAPSGRGSSRARLNGIHLFTLVGPRFISLSADGESFLGQDVTLGLVSLPTVG